MPSKKPKKGYPQRIVCLTEETTETLYAIGADKCIVGISNFTVRPPQAAKEKPKVSQFIRADYDKILELKPDLVLGFSDIQAQIAHDLIKKGLNVMIFNQRSVDEILSTIRVIGSLVGFYKEAEKYSDALKKNIDSVRKKTARKKNRPKAYFEEWPDPMISCIRWVSELVEIAGADDIFSELRTKSVAPDRVVQLEEVIHRNPDIILASWCGKKVMPDQIRNRPGFADIKAVQNNRIHEILSDIILQPGPASLTDGLKALCEAI